MAAQIQRVGSAQDGLAAGRAVAAATPAGLKIYVFNLLRHRPCLRQAHLGVEAAIFSCAYVPLFMCAS